MRYMLTREEIDGLPACRGPYREHLWARGTGTLYCQSCTLVVDFKDGKPSDAATDEQGSPSS